MIDWNQGGFTGSVRRWVRREVKQHRSRNKTLKRERYSYGVRILRRFLANRSFVEFLLLYVSIDVLALGLEIATSGLRPSLLPNWSATTPELKGLLKDATSYFISAQVGVLGVVSIAVGLVTLIAQRDNSPHDIQIYYHESLAQEVVASSIALLLILSVQVLWPVHFSIHQIGIGNSNAIFKVGLTSLHLLWLVVNLVAMAHFVRTSLRFVQPRERASIRKQYSANFVIPDDMVNRLTSVVYSNGAEGLFANTERNQRPVVFFGSSLLDTGEAEIEASFDSRTERIKRRHVDPKRLEEIRKQAEGRCLTYPAGVLT